VVRALDERQPGNDLGAVGSGQGGPPRA